jgi:iron-sulfur cluster repair protein YtfE (RIC family)
METAVQNFSNLLDRLSAEHADLLPCTAHLIELASSNSPQLREAIERCASKLGGTLDAHIADEDDVLFPAYARESGDQALVGQFRDEHRVIETLRNELLAAHKSQADVQEIANIAVRLADLLHSHMTREDMVLFPSARQALC